MARKLAALVTVAALGGCAGFTSGEFAQVEDVILTAEPRPALSGYEYEYEEEGEPFINFGARGGLVLYLGAEDEVKPRITVGAYGRLLEDEAKRLEVSIEVTPDIENISRQNMYFSFVGDYVGFLGDMLYWKAGGGGIFEMRGDTNYFLVLLEGGVGLWFEVGGEEVEVPGAVAVNFMLQLLVGEKNVPAMISITGGYEF